MRVSPSEQRLMRTLARLTNRPAAWYHKPMSLRSGKRGYDLAMDDPSCYRLQQETKEVVHKVFGGVNGTDPRIRILRFMEEAIELAQAAGLSREDVDALASQVYDKLVGEIEVEIGDVGVTLMMYATSQNVELDLSIRTRLKRLLSKPVGYFRDRELGKRV